MYITPFFTFLVIIHLATTYKKHLSSTKKGLSRYFYQDKPDSILRLFFYKKEPTVIITIGSIKTNLLKEGCYALVYIFHICCRLKSCYNLTISIDDEFCKVPFNVRIVGIIFVDFLEHY